MTNFFQRKLIFFIIAMGSLLISCQQAGGDNPGSEYMPDMGHSVAYEANYYDYYSHNRWGGEENYYHYAQPRKPIAGTVSRSIHADNSYHYGNTEEERQRATEEIIQNPYPITAKGLATGKELYNIYCGICHGDKGDGAGYLVREDGGKYPVQPANLLLDQFVNASNGRLYHAIMYGKNLMGAYKDKLKYEERWQVLHYIRSLQAKSLKVTYNEEENTLNEVEIPYKEYLKNQKVAAAENHEVVHEEGHKPDAPHNHAH